MQHRLEISACHFPKSLAYPAATVVISYVASTGRVTRGCSGKNATAVFYSNLDLLEVLLLLAVLNMLNSDYDWSCTVTTSPVLDLKAAWTIANNNCRINLTSRFGDVWAKTTIA